MVYRFETSAMSLKKRIIYCKPLAHTFNKDNFLDNLLNCNYENRRAPNPTKQTSERRYYRNNKRHRIPPTEVDISHERPKNYYNKKRK